MCHHLDLEIISSVLIIIGIDLILGGDNAIVIALACRNLPEKDRNKAIIIGTGLAIVLRSVLTIGALYLLQVPFLQFIGGLLLLWIAFQLLNNQSDNQTKITSNVTIGSVVKTIIFADLVMGLDNVIAVAGAAKGNIYLVIFGLLISVPIVIWGSKLILFIIERFPTFIYFGAGILAYTAGTMILAEERLEYFYMSIPLITKFVPVIAIFVVFASSFFSKKLKYVLD